MRSDIWELIERTAENYEQYEGWNEEVFDYIKENTATTAFLEMLKSVFESCPSYVEGKAVKIDM